MQWIEDAIIRNQVAFASRSLIPFYLESIIFHCFEGLLAPIEFNIVFCDSQTTCLGAALWELFELVLKFVDRLKVTSFALVTAHPLTIFMVKFVEASQQEAAIPA